MSPQSRQFLQQAFFFCLLTGGLSDAEVLAAHPLVENRLLGLFRELRGGGLLPFPGTNATIAATATAATAVQAAVGVAASLGSITTALPAGAHDSRMDGLTAAELVAALTRSYSSPSNQGVREVGLRGLSALLLPVIRDVAVTSLSATVDPGINTEQPSQHSATQQLQAKVLSENVAAARAAGVVPALVDVLFRFISDSSIVRSASSLLAAVVEGDIASFNAAADAGALPLLSEALTAHNNSPDTLVGVCAALGALLRLARNEGTRRWSLPHSSVRPAVDSQQRAYKFGDFTRSLLRTVSGLPKHGLQRTLSGLHELGGRVYSGDWPADVAAAEEASPLPQPLPANFAAQVRTLILYCG